MRKEWWKEPILQFKGVTVGGHFQEFDNDGNLIRDHYGDSICFDELYKKKYWKDALYWYRKAASQDEPLSLQMLGCIEDFKQVKEKAIAGDKDAQFRLSVYYHDAYGTKLDLRKSSEWLKIAAINGSKEAIQSVSDWNCVTKSEKKVTDEDFYPEPGIKPEDYEDYYMLERHGSVKNKDIEEIRLIGLWELVRKLDVEETKALANLGDPEKQYQLAWLYDWGLGVKQDIIIALQWFVRSACNRYAPAQTELGIIYHYGIMATVSGSDRGC